MAGWAICKKIQKVYSKQNLREVSNPERKGFQGSALGEHLPWVHHEIQSLSHFPHRMSLEGLHKTITGLFEENRREILSWLSLESSHLLGLER